MSKGMIELLEYVLFIYALSDLIFYIYIIDDNEESPNIPYFVLNNILKIFLNKKYNK